MTSPVTQVFQVEGMTCEHCVRAVSEELRALPGVTDVSVDLGRPSTVTVSAAAPLQDVRVAAALDEAGDYRLVAS